MDVTALPGVRMHVDKYNNIYAIRDVFAHVSNGGRLVTCQYAVLSDDGNRTAWYDCPEGVSFSEIEPYIPANAITPAKLSAAQLADLNS